MSAQLYALIAQRQELSANAERLREGHLLDDPSVYGEARRGIELFDAHHQADSVYTEWLRLDTAVRTVEYVNGFGIDDSGPGRLRDAQSALDKFLDEHRPESSNDDDDDLMPEPAPIP